MIPKTICPQCNSELCDPNVRTKPIVGMFAICIYCAKILIFNENLCLIEPLTTDHIPYHIKESARLLKKLIDGGAIVKDTLKK